MSCLSGPYEFGDQPPAQQQQDLPFCVQSYAVPERDERYLAVYDMQEGVQCTVLARRFSSRYTHPFDDPGSLIQERLAVRHGPYMATCAHAGVDIVTVATRVAGQPPNPCHARDQDVCASGTCAEAA